MAHLRCLTVALVAATAACRADDPECNGFGCPSSVDAGSNATMPSNGSSGASTSDDDAATTLASSGAATTDAPATTAGDESTTSAGASSDTAPGDTTGAPCRGADCPTLGECFGVGVWESCTQYCAAGKATCVPAGCDGATVVYYGDANACVDMRSNGESDQSCDADFMQGGATSFARCCCE
ncbi:MAG TPA: hypothetical protein VFG69_05835 [Nannocystaceae bacterium]|nr:hypothetical protein [Nannocystaceae bacterium]